MIRTARIAGSILVGCVLFAWGVPLRAQDVAVDAAGLNSGNLASGALKFGAQEPQDFRLCLISHRVGHPGPCPLVPTLVGIASNRTGPLNQFGLDLFTSDEPRLSITRGGRIGMGISNPSYNLHLLHSGDVQIALESTDRGHRLWTLQSSGTVDPSKAGTFQIIDRDQNVQRLGIDSEGMVSVKSLQITGGSDLAEPFSTASLLPPGSIVIIDDREPGRLIGSSRAYDRRVAGVVSGANNIEPGVSLTQIDPGKEAQPVALSGRVYALADTSNGAIRPGDLLTTSTQPAHAMRATDLRRSQGAIIGKAMSGLQSGSGLVLVLVSLQ